MPPATCHPERPHRARGLCASCYMRDRRARDHAAVRAAEICYAYKHRAERAKAVGLWKRANPDRARLAVQRWVVNNAEYVRQTRAPRNHRRRAALRGQRGIGVSVAEWSTILETFGHRCAYCLRGGLRLTRDHVLAISAGGADEAGNVVPACGRCNSRKGARTLLGSIAKQGNWT